MFLKTERLGLIKDPFVVKPFLQAWKCKLFFSMLVNEILLSHLALW